jgi:hypothetical protein
MEKFSIPCNVLAYFLFLFLRWIDYKCDVVFLFPAQSLELVRMAPSGDGMKWIMRAPKTEASSAALPLVAMRY